MTAERPLEGQVALVTGAGRGIGEATARLLATRGARVAIAARTEVELVVAATRIADAGGVALPVRADVTDEAQVARLFREVRERLGPLDLLVNNAGTAEPVSVAQATLAQLRANVDSSLLSTFLCTRAALEDMLARRRGRIVNVASVAGVAGIDKLPGLALYSAAKAGVIAFTEALAAEVAPDGVRVACVSPGSTRTALFERVAPEGQAAHLLPADVARVIAWLCSPEASAVNGANVVVRG